MPSIVPVVEGPGDLEATPILLRKILYGQCNRFDIGVARPKKANGKGNLKRDLEKFLRYAALNPDCAGILVLIDSDDDCPVELTQIYCERARQAGLSVPIVVVCAVKEYEAWFIASLDTIKDDSLGGGSIISAEASYSGDVESISGVKAWLGDQMPSGRAYRETTDQASLTDRIDISLAASNSRSFVRLCHAVDEIVAAIDSGTAVITPFPG